MTSGRQQSAEDQVLRRLERFVREVVRPAEVVGRCALDMASRTIGGEPVPWAEAVAGPFTPLSPGDAWGRAWDTVWVHVTGEVPGLWDAAHRGTRLALEVDVDLGFDASQAGFQAEGLVHDRRGRVLRGVAPRNHLVALDAEAGDPVDLWVEAAANPTISNAEGTDLVHLAPLGSWAGAGEALLYRVGEIRLVLRDTLVSALLADVEVLRGVAVDAGAGRRRRVTVVAALERMLEALDPRDVAGTVEAARERLAPALAAPAHASAMTLTAVGHAHIDSAWLWPLRETVRKCARTFSNVLALMDAEPGLVFVCSSAQQLAWMKQHYPDLFERIRARVAEGRFVPVGGMWVESDTNLPGGESLVRQFVAGQGFFTREFGMLCEEVWLPDSFGYSGALPQIARSAGARWFFGQKLSWNRTNRMPHHTFDWEGIDGTRVLAHFTPVDTYNSDLSPVELAYAEENFEDHATAGGGIVPFGYGDGGGGPTREMMGAAHRSRDLEGLPRVRLGSARDFFADAEQEPGRRAVWSGAMYLELHRGTYSAQSRTKRGNRRCESWLRQAELWATTAAARTSYAYPAETFRRAWEDVLLLQFHDILPGSSISWVHEDAERMHAETEAVLRGVVHDALAALAAQSASTSAPSAPSVAMVANGSPFTRRGVPAFAVGVAVDVDDAAVLAREGTDLLLTNARLRLRVSATGHLTELREHGQERSLFDDARPGNELHLHQDIPTAYDAWDVDEHYRRLRTVLSEARRVEAVVRDDGSPGVVVERTFGSSTVTQEIGLVPGAAEVEIVTTVDWHERQQLLKLAFPFRLDARSSSAETQFGHLVRPTHTNTSWEQAQFEVVAHRWLHVSDGVVGAGVVNDAVYGHDVERLVDGTDVVTQVRQTLLRGPLYPDPESDQGRHTFRTRLVVSATLDPVIASAHDLDVPLVPVLGSAPVDPLVRVEGDGVVVDAVKQAEDGSGDVVLRLHEAHGRPASCAVDLAGARARRVDVLERDLDGPAADPEPGAGAGDTLSRELRAFELLTLRAAPR